MQIDNALVERIAKLSKLEFSDEEKTVVKKNLSEILALVEKLEELDTSSVKPLEYMSTNENILRKDEVKRPISKEEALSNAPKKDSDYIKVPKVM